CVGLVFLLALAGPVIAPYPPLQQQYSVAMKAPSPDHPFGTDKFGRDQLSRILYGTQIDLMIGLICTVVPFLVGVTIGCVSGYYGGLVDTIFMRIVDIQVAFPFY